MSKHLATLIMGMAALVLFGVGAAANYPAPVEGDFTISNFLFHTGETIPKLKVHYRTIGDPSGQPVLILHGTTGSGASMLAPSFAGELFGPGQPLDATKYFLILPDAIGTGKTTKPSDGLKGAFPRYNYDDMVNAQFRLVTEGLGIKKLRAVVGYSMGGMHAWVWGVNYPEAMDAIVPMAAQPTAMASRNWVMRRMIIDSVRNDPAWKNGFYETQPEHFRLVNVWYGLATNGGNLAFQDKAPTRARADELVDKAIANRTTIDANDYLYQWDASRDFDASPKLDRIRAHVLVVNAADDERNPPESGLMEKELARLENATYCLIPASAETSGHATNMTARLWKDQLDAFLKNLP